MVETLPALTGVPPADSQVWLTAVAKAAAELAAQEADRRRESGPITREVVEEIAERVAKEVVSTVFGEFDVDLSDRLSKRGFREDLSHARRAREWWGKAGQILFTAVMMSLAGGLIAAVVKYISIGGGR